MSNILKAFINIVANYRTDVNLLNNGNNRANNTGDGLEEYIKNAFADTINEIDTQRKLKKFSQTYAYSGNKNNDTTEILGME